MLIRHDVVAVGARTARAATAMLLARLATTPSCWTELTCQATHPREPDRTPRSGRAPALGPARSRVGDRHAGIATPALTGLAWSCSSPNSRSPGCSRPMTGRRASGLALPPLTRKAVRRRSGSREEAFGELLGRSAPQLAGRLRHARRTSPVQGMLRQPNQVRQAFGPGWALVGDAGYHRDAITAHGISDAFRDAEFLAIALDQALRAGAEEGTALAPLPAAARPGAQGDLRDHLPPGGLSGGAGVHRAAKAAQRRHRHRGSGAGRPADPRRCLLATA